MKRLYQSLLEARLRSFPCVAVVGPRQCGKTTLLKRLPKGWDVFDLEKSADREEVLRDPDLFFRLHPGRVAVDEAQSFPALFPALRVAVDADRSAKGRFVITGSSSPHLLRSVSESLAGRVAIIEMAPFSSAEAFGLPESPFFSLLERRAPLRDWPSELRPRKDLRQIHDFWWRGGFPEPWLEKKPSFHREWMDQYVETYVQRDVMGLFPGLNRDRFRLFTQMLSGLSGTVVNFSETARALGVSSPTARDYFEIAHGSFLWRTLPPYERNAVKRVVKHPRGHFRDSGLLHHLMRLPDLKALLSHPRMGFSWEGMVTEDILRGLEARGVSHDAYFYRTGAGAKVDLVLEGFFGLVPIEINYVRTEPRGLRALSDFIEERKCPYGLVINNNERPRLLTEKILGVPFSCL